jgi:predicted PurR-regulated permease PerM
MEEKKNPFASLSDKELEAMLKRLEDSNERQASYAKKQYRMSQITALASILILAIVIYTSATIIPRVNRLFDDVETVMDSVNVVAKELEANLGQMVTDIDNLVTSSDQSVKEALRQINSVDIQTLNQAILDLSNLISPLARFFGK